MLNLNIVSRHFFFTSSSKFLLENNDRLQTQLLYTRASTYQMSIQNVICILRVLVACWLKCWPTIERLHRFKPTLGTGTASFRGDLVNIYNFAILDSSVSHIKFLVKPLVQRKKSLLEIVLLMTSISY